MTRRLAWTLFFKARRSSSDVADSAAMRPAEAEAERRAMLGKRRKTGRIRLRVRVDRQEIVVKAWSNDFRRKLELAAALKGP
jgi:hypothetical protein